MSVSATVNAIVPLALLEAIRNLDTPLDDGLSAELAGETFTKRLGLSSTVAAQIQRYRDMVSRGDGVTDEEAVQVFRLVGRRSDATLVYSDAGRRAARLAARRYGGSLGPVGRFVPKATRRRMGVRAAARAIRRAFGLELKADPGGPWVGVRDSLASRAGFEGSGCFYYAALIGEALRVASDFEGSMIHEKCKSRGDAECRWKAADADQRW
ncbi:MAG: hypothetical protein FJ206_13790 [Gemmatimonadetes bacterium]|nr:hypothetical protein [Gemmatimonadota bacterium]